MKHISASKIIEYIGWFCVGIAIGFFLSSCGDDDRILSPENVFRSSSSSPTESSAPSSSSSAAISSESSSSSSFSPSYIAPDFLVATSSRLFRGYLQNGIPRIELFAENRHVVNSGCRYSIDSNGRIFDHLSGTSWDSGIREAVASLGIYYYKYHDAIYICTISADYRVPINGTAIKINSIARSWYLADGWEAYSQMPRAFNSSLFCGNYHYMHDGTKKQCYEISADLYYPAFIYRGNPHESSLMTHLSGKTTFIKCGDYTVSTTNTIKDGDLTTDQIKIGSTWYLGNGGTITATAYTFPTNAQRTSRKFALHDDGNYMWWYDSEADHVVRNSIHAPESFIVTDSWQYNVTLPSSTTPDAKCALRMNPMSLMRFENGYWMYINKNGSLLCKNVCDNSMRVVMTNISGALAVNIKPDRFHGERGY